MDLSAFAVVPPPPQGSEEGRTMSLKLLRLVKEALAAPGVRLAGAALGAGVGSYATLRGEVGMQGSGSLSPLFANYRPANLPPKPSKEASKHRKEVERVNSLYREKLQKEAKSKALKRQKDNTNREALESARRKENQQQKEREAKMDEQVAFWVDSLLPNWTSKKVWSKGVDVVYREGIPPRVRGRVWPKAIGNGLSVTPQLWTIFLQHAQHARAAHTCPPTTGGRGVALAGKENTFADIDVDLARTFPHLAFFQEGCPMNHDLRDLLDAYCFYRPDRGYVQGMSYLAGNLLLYMPNKAEAFVVFANLLNTPFFNTVFLLTDTKVSLLTAHRPPPTAPAPAPAPPPPPSPPPTVTVVTLIPVVKETALRYSIFEDLFKHNLPELYKHFESVDLSPQMYFMRWCITLFCKSLKIDIVGRVWDCFFIQGEVRSPRLLGLLGL
jgi:hypothetical protein